MTESTPLALCWDIDGTLLSTARAGAFAWEDGVRDVLGHEVSLENFDTAGLTDVEISRLLVRKVTGGDDHGAAARVLERYEELLPSRLHYRKGGVLPGVRAVLEHTRSLDVMSLLLTGNTQAGARAKLTHYDLLEFFPGPGAFADDTEDRPSIARKAIGLVEAQWGPPVARDRVYVIGDTPHDIRCGDAIGVRTVAVATGTYTLEQLTGHGAWRALSLLPAPTDFMRLLAG